jgi:hypothetical protein
MTAVAMLSCVALSRAQTAGTITGTISDESGAVVPNATVTITNTLTGVVVRTLQSGSSGVYDAEALPVGTYQVAAEASGFGRSVRSGITLNVADRVEIDFVMKVGAVSKTVEVKAEAGAVVQTQTGDQSQLIATSQISELPILGRSFMQLQQLVPGSSKEGPDEIGKGFYGTRGYAINGASEDYTGYELDGVQNNDTGNAESNMTNPGPDVLAEVKVLSSNYSAKYGTAAGAVILAVTKSGTHDFHGGAYGYDRNDKLDAADFFLNAANELKSPLRYNDFGYTLGGPFYIPGHYNTDKSKTFFFWGEEWLRIREKSTIVTATPTVAMRNGDFTGYGPLLNPTNPTTGLPMTTPSGAPCVSGANMDQIAPSCIDNNVSLLLNQDFPLPTTTGFFNYVAGATTGQNWTEQMIRVDQNIKQKTRAFVRYIHDGWIENDPTTLWSSDSFPTIHSRVDVPSRNFIAKVTNVLSPTTLNEISYSWNSDYPSPKTDSMLILGADTKPAGYNVQQIFNENPTGVVPDMSFSGGWGGISSLWGNPWRVHENHSMATEDFAKQVGRHSLQAGAMYIFSIIMLQGEVSPNYQGAYNFTGAFTNNPIADALLDRPYTYAEAENGSRIAFYNYHQFETYFQDDWKATRRLTLNLGLRWFAIPHQYSLQISNFQASAYNPAQAVTVTPSGQIVPNTGTPLNGIVLAGQNGTPRGLVKNYWNTFAPRFGFAYDLFGDGKTAIRGGYGMGYYRIQDNDIQEMQGNAPFTTIATYFSPPFDNPGLGSTVAGPASLQAVNPVYKLPGIQSWSLGIQRELPANTLLSVAYVGSKGTHMDLNANINQPLPAMGYDFDPRIACTATTPYPCTSRVSTDYVRPYLGWSTINQVSTVGNSIYNALQARLEKRVSGGMTLAAAYTWSRAIGIGGVEGLGSSTVQNAYNLAAERGPTGYDRTHVLVANFVYQLPFLHSLTGAPGLVLKGWEATGVVTFESGMPLTAGYSSPTQGLAIRPDAVAGTSVSGPKAVDQWFNINAFAAPPFGYFGNAGYNTIRGPGMNNWDLGAFKNFKIRERATVQFRAEFFNAFNHAQFNTVATTLGAGGFGEITSAHTPRVVQLALRLAF